ncbi:hypothetical protein VVD49_01200 [Uliginosibacterium sp. H3]|uniref:Chemotaxis protein n=1 Tax=Uliginosibacterium silvisoli TaxID=3114758 RepID=A0ABU6JZP4_9RHOO|nr:hypothetical protein [Uliginosibacterium sp. H3]
MKGLRMPAGWISVLQLVPWGEVIANAPKLADAAKNFWGKVAKKPPAAPDTSSAPSLQAQVAQLHEQMLASSELIKALAEQNTQLIKRVETMRRRTLGLAVIVAITLAIAIAALLR